MNHINTEFAPKPVLSYPFELKWAPAPGEPFAVAEGVYWLRMPLPMSLDHINLWLLRDGDEWVIVDTGVDDATCKEVWDKVFDGFLNGQRVNRIIVTHYHPDHIGLASWLALRCDCKVHISKGEYAHYRSIISRDQKTSSVTVREHFRSLGFDERTTEGVVAFFKVDQKPKEARLQDGQVAFISADQTLLIDSQQWQVVIGNGHSPEHACLYNADRKILISGDQALPRISSNVSVYPGSDVVDPLNNWLQSCAKLESLIGDDVMVLPAHNEPFRKLSLRMQQLVYDHVAQLNKLRACLASPMTAVQACAELFPRELNHVETVLATGETLAHIHYLLQRGEISRTIDDDGVAKFEVATTTG